MAEISPTIARVILPSRRMVCAESRLGAPGKEILSASPSCRVNASAFFDDVLADSAAEGATQPVTRTRRPNPATALPHFRQRKPWVTIWNAAAEGRKREVFIG